MNPTELTPSPDSPEVDRSASPAALRPSFRIALRIPRDEAIDHVRARLNETLPDRWVGKGRWAEIHVPGPERKLWSPHLSLRFDHPDPGSSDGSLLYARYAPRPEIWTGLVFIYAVLGFAGVFGATLGYVQWASDETAWGLWVAGLAIPGIAAIHVLGAIGRRLSQDQMRELRGRLDPVIDGIRMGTSARPDGSR